MASLLCSGNWAVLAAVLVSHPCSLLTKSLHCHNMAPWFICDDRENVHTLFIDPAFPCSLKPDFAEHLLQTKESSIRTIKLIDVELSNSSGVEKLLALPDLQNLHISTPSSPFNCSSLHEIETTLRELVLEKTPVSGEINSLLGTAPALEVVDIRHCPGKLTARSVGYHLVLPNLKHLSVENTSLQWDPQLAFLAAPRLAYLAIKQDNQTLDKLWVKDIQKGLYPGLLTAYLTETVCKLTSQSYTCTSPSDESNWKSPPRMLLLLCKLQVWVLLFRVLAQKQVSLWKNR